MLRADKHMLEPNEERPRGGNARTFLILSIVLNIILALFIGYSYGVNTQQRGQIDDLTSTLNATTQSIRLLEQQLNMTNTQLEYYIELANFYSSQVSTGDGGDGVIGQSTIPIVAVYSIQRGFDVEYQGVVMEAEIDLVEGSGRILVNTVPLIGIDIQSSVNTAVIVVEQLTGISLSSTDVILTIRGEQEVQVVDGGSAGAAITVALLSAVTNQELSEGVYMTGTIKNDQTVGEIGGAAYKALAVAELGGDKFLVPRGQSVITVYKPRTIEFFGRRITTYDRVYMDLEDYLEEQGYALDVIEVETISDALDVFTA